MTFVVAIDGPAGTGKSTVSRELARRLGFDFLDTGAMYRSVAAACLDGKVDPDDEESVTSTAQSLPYDPATGSFPSVSGSLRSMEVTEAASRVARHPGVRRQLVEWQRQFAEGRRLVTEGRDQGTDVFPRAQCKYFLTATVEERTCRRVAELNRSGAPVDANEVRQQIELRDERDRNRTVAPLRPADDAQVIDTTAVSIEEVVTRLEDAVKKRLIRDD